LKRLRAATVEELMAVPGIGRRTAEAVQAAIAEPLPGPDEAAEPAGNGEADTAVAAGAPAGGLVAS
jgi:excinuclease ABC subunit C